MKSRLFALCLLAVAAFDAPAHADFAISETIIDFTDNSPRQRDIEVVSREKDDQFVATQVIVVDHPGAADEKRIEEKNPEKSGLLITPGKMVLPANSRKTIRFLLLKPEAETDRIYRVVIKPVVKGVEGGNSRVALKILVGYEALVIVRPKNPHIDLTADRQGNQLTITNKGNTNAYLQSGEQCNATGGDCKQLNIARIYAGQRWSTTLPHMDGKVTYRIFDGTSTQSQSF